MPDPCHFPTPYRQSSWVKPENLYKKSDESDESSSLSSSTSSSSSSTSSPAMAIIRSASSRRLKLQEQAQIDKTIFCDQSLGCPLATFEWATLGLVGGKALQCWKLTRHGFPMPASYVIPTYAYSLHIQQAGINDEITSVFCELTKSAASDRREQAERQLALIRTKILETPLHGPVRDNLRAFLNTLPEGTCYAVRSSATAEDTVSQSFAGQYDTFLYKTKLNDICHSIKACWASMFKPHILDYALHADDSSQIQTPTMAVLIMHMVEATASGVIFSQNLWGNKDEVMIEAVLGQGEGLVNGELTPDRYVLDKYSRRLCYQNISSPQTHKFVRADNQDGVEKVKVDPPHDGPVVHQHQLEYLARLAREVEDFENRPQDMEWALDESGVTYLLQSRPITTTVSTSLAFLPPGDGFWTFDPTHFPRPVSPWMQEVYSFDYGIEHSHRIGCLVKTIKLRFVHGFAFTQPEMFPGNRYPALESAGRAYWTKKLYEEDYREFQDWFKPECVALQKKLCDVNPSALGHSELVEHVAQCYDYAAEFWKKHHTYTMPAFIIVGDYMNRMAELTSKDPMECLVLLESTSPESRGILNRKDPLLAKMYKLLRESDRAKKLLEMCDDKTNASWCLDCLLHLPDELGDTMREVALHFGWRLAGGYDIVVPALIESPDFFLKTIRHGVNQAENLADQGERKSRKIANEWKLNLPEEKHEEFEEIFKLGRSFFGMRDERGLATDLSGVGLCRRGILEAGRRLVESGVIQKKEHLTVAVKREAIALLTGNLANARSNTVHGPVEVPTAQVLQKRFDYIKEADPSIVPRSLGTRPKSPPGLSDTMPFVARTMAAMESSLLKGTYDTTVLKQDGEEDSDQVKGVPASMGKVTGPVCLVLSDSDLQSVKKGDIVVTYSSSASFNIVLGLCSAIVTDYGGMLSHAAIVAREYGIPAVVGTQNATKKFKSGDIVYVDSSLSTVRKVV